MVEPRKKAFGLEIRYDSLIPHTATFAASIVKDKNSLGNWLSRNRQVLIKAVLKADEIKYTGETE